MKMDLDEMYEEWQALRPRVIAMLEDYEARKANPTPAPATIVIDAPALPGKEAAKTALESGRSLDDVGAQVGLSRVSKATGHGFDEDDASYRKRLLSDIIGWPATEAMPQGFMMMDVYPDPHDGPGQDPFVHSPSDAELDGLLNRLEPQEQADEKPPKGPEGSGAGGSAEKPVDNPPPVEQVAETAAEGIHDPVSAASARPPT